MREALVVVEAEAASAQQCGSFQDLEDADSAAKFVDLSGVPDTILGTARPNRDELGFVE